MLPSLIVRFETCGTVAPSAVREREADSRLTNLYCFPLIVVLKTDPAGNVESNPRVEPRLRSTVAVGAVYDEGVYPSDLACETIEERCFAVSRNISFATKLLYTPW